jgi:hypothetical protein
VGLQDGLHSTENLTLPGFNPQTAHPTGIGYSDCTTQTTTNLQ